MEASKKSVFPTSFSRGLFHRNLCSFENEIDLQIIYLMSLVSKTSFYCCVLSSCSRIIKFDYKISRWIFNFANFLLEIFGSQSI